MGESREPAVDSVEFTCLSSADPGQYIKLRRINDRINYLEHLDGGSGSVTYWGEPRIELGKRTDTPVGVG